MDPSDTCWICHGGSDDSTEPLFRPTCRCVRNLCHLSCAARWFTPRVVCTASGLAIDLSAWTSRFSLRCDVCAGDFDGQLPAVLAALIAHHRPACTRQGELVDRVVADVASCWDSHLPSETAVSLTRTLALDHDGLLDVAVARLVCRFVERGSDDWKWLLQCLYAEAREPRPPRRHKVLASLVVDDYIALLTAVCTGVVLTVLVQLALALLQEPLICYEPQSHRRTGRRPGVPSIHMADVGVSRFVLQRVSTTLNDSDVPKTMFLGWLAAPDGIMSVGRHPANDVLIDSAELPELSSKFHASLRLVDGFLCVRDLGSTNGTYVNGQRAVAFQDTRLGEDDVVGFGGPRTVKRDGAIICNPFTYKVARLGVSTHPPVGHALFSPWPSERPAALVTQEEAPLPRAQLLALKEAWADELDCGVCLESMLRPYTLPCGHAFCLDCLVNTVRRSGLDRRCPICRGVFASANPCIKLDRMVSQVAEPVMSEAERADRLRRMDGIANYERARERTNADYTDALSKQNEWIVQNQLFSTVELPPPLSNTIGIIQVTYRLGEASEPESQPLRRSGRRVRPRRE